MTTFKFQLKYYLEDQTVTDEVLIEKMNEAASFESERQQKLRKNTCSKITKMCELQTAVQVHQQSHERSVERIELRDHPADTDNKEKGRKAPTVSTKKESELYEVVKQLKEEVAEMRKAIRESPQPYRHSQPMAK